MPIKQSLHNKIYYRLFLLLAFVIPIHDRVVAPVIVLIVVNWFIEGRFRLKLNRLLADKQRLILISFASLYLVYALGLIYSENISEALFGLEVKLSLLVFPVIFATIDSDILDGKKLNRLFFSFIAGCFLISIGLLIKAFINYTQSLSVNEFYYINMAAWLHPSYFSMYLNLAISIIVVFLINYRKTLSLKTKLILAFVATFFFFFIILLSSKAGILSLGIVSISCVVYLILRKQKYQQAFSLLSVVVLYFILAFYVFPNSLHRFYEAKSTLNSFDQIESGNTESTAERIIIWKAATSLIKEKLVIGQGIGDVNDALCLTYKNKKIWQAYHLQLNAHNQYLQTFLATGVIGLLILLLCLFVPAWICLRNKYFIYLLFLIIVGFNFLFESMLCRQSGVVFYAFFNACMWFFVEHTAPTKEGVPRI